ncbi:hypothetical protein AJ80_02271 [Polytolypa hystricis UAMH7299]|uniref:Uncharacterized protein n=1 Tax=Polytolypa hystricis (strain UAMH7299) TaxID=1447883 RepID=A0A2B7YQR9_POLH7|nr:hypothetical protein AJ80_02271 [Polytolypa hystricis UAMH7299]
MVPQQALWMWEQVGVPHPEELSSATGTTPGVNSPSWQDAGPYLEPRKRLDLVEATLFAMDPLLALLVDPCRRERHDRKEPVKSPQVLNADDIGWQGEAERGRFTQEAEQKGTRDGKCECKSAKKINFST